MIYAKFMYPDNGYSSDRQKCKELGLVVGEVYEMTHISVGDSASTVYLTDFPCNPFNSVHFEFYELIESQMVSTDVYSRFYNDNYW